MRAPDAAVCTAGLIDAMAASRVRAPVCRRRAGHPHHHAAPDQVDQLRSTYIDRGDDPGVIAYLEQELPGGAYGVGSTGSSTNSTAPPCCRKVDHREREGRSSERQRRLTTP